MDERKRRAVDDGYVPHPNDEEYTRALEYGYSPTAGGGMGVDRLVMILTERDTLREVIRFPSSRSSGEPPKDLAWAPLKLDLDPGVVAACREAARQISAQVAQRIAGHMTMSVERSIVRMLGVEGANELEVPPPTCWSTTCTRAAVSARGSRTCSAPRCGRRPRPAADR